MFNRFCFAALLLAGILLPLSSCGGGPSLTSIVISPATINFGLPGLTVQLTAIGYYTHPDHPAETKNITNQVSWTSSAPECVTVSRTGLITSGIYGCTNILVTASAPGFNGIIQGTMTVNVTQPAPPNNDIVTVAVIPAAQTVASLGVTIQYEAIGTTSAGTTKALNNQPGLSWVSSDQSVAKIDGASGLATTAGAGTTSITAIFKNSPDGTAAEGSATLTVAPTSPTGSPEPLTALTVAPNAQTALAIGQTAHFLAIATTGSGTSVNLTHQSATVNGATIAAAVWSSSNPSVATVDPATGIATAVSAGATVITAIATNPNDQSVVTGAATYTVTVSTSTSSEPLTGLSIVPSAQTALAVNQKVNFIAIGATGSGGSVNLTNQSATINGTTVAAAVWSSSNQSVATVDPGTGVATALSAGVTAITAIATNPGDKTVVTATALFTVTVPSQTEAYVSLAIVPSSQTATAVNQTAQFIAIGTTGTGTTVDLTSKATWNSSSLAVAMPTATAGQFTAVANGVAAITAEVKNPSNDGTVVTGSAVLNVNIAPTTEPLLSMSIMPSAQSAAAGQPVQLLAIGTFSATAATPGQQNMPVTGYSVAWYSSNPSVATICSGGLPAPSCTGVPDGTVTGVSAGTTAITAIAKGNPDKSLVTAVGTFTVTGPAPSAITGISINPAAQTIAMPQIGSPNPTVTLVVIGTNAAGFQSAVTPQVWTSSNPQVLLSTSIVSTGNIATATIIGAGTTNILATYTNPANAGGAVVTASATLTATGPAAEPLLSLTINPSLPSVSYPGQTDQLSAIGTFSAPPVTQDLTGTVTWSSSNPAIATICNAIAAGTVPVSCATTPGLVTGVSQGTVAITAMTTNTKDGSLVYATVPFTVTAGSAETMSALTIIPSSLALSATGQPGTLVALGTNAVTGLQEDVTASPQLAWTSNNTAIATVSSTTQATQTQTCVPNATPPPAQTCTYDSAGVVKGVSAGSTNVTAEYTNKPAAGSTPAQVITAQASVDVTSTPAAEPLLSISVLPTDTTITDLLGTGQYLAYGTFSTAPTALDITNGFFHAGFPNASCTDTYAQADAATAAADAAANLPLNNLPYAQCSFVPVKWISVAPYIFPINSAGALGATGGLVTADGSGTDDIYAQAANPDSTLVYSPIVTFNCPYIAPTYGTTTVTLPNGTTTTTTDYNDVLNLGSCNYLTVADSLLSTLTVFNAGVNTSNWLITAPSATGTADVIHCGGTTEQATQEGSVCTATYPNGTTVLITAPAESGVKFGGWSDTCISTNPVLPSANGPNTCTVVVGGGCIYNQQTTTFVCDSSNVSVGAVFN